MLEGIHIRVCALGGLKICFDRGTGETNFVSSKLAGISCPNLLLPAIESLAIDSRIVLSPFSGNDVIAPTPGFSPETRAIEEASETPLPNVKHRCVALGFTTGEAADGMGEPYALRRYSPKSKQDRLSGNFVCSQSRRAESVSCTGSYDTQLDNST